MPLRPFSSGTVARAAYAPPPSNFIDARVLGVATAERHTLPTGAKKVIFSADTNFYALFGDSTVVAAIPAADVVNGSAPELNPESREIPDGVTHVSLISPAAGIVTLSFYGE